MPTFYFHRADERVRLLSLSHCFLLKHNRNLFPVISLPPPTPSTLHSKSSTLNKISDLHKSPIFTVDKSTRVRWSGLQRRRWQKIYNNEQEARARRSERKTLTSEAINVAALKDYLILNPPLAPSPPRTHINNNNKFSLQSHLDDYKWRRNDDFHLSHSHHTRPGPAHHNSGRSLASAMIRCLIYYCRLIDFSALHVNGVTDVEVMSFEALAGSERT